MSKTIENGITDFPIASSPLDYRLQLSGVTIDSWDDLGNPVQAEITFGELEELKQREMKFWDSLNERIRLRLQRENDAHYRPIKFVP